MWHYGAHYLFYTVIATNRIGSTHNFLYKRVGVRHHSWWRGGRYNSDSPCFWQGSNASGPTEKKPMFPDDLLLLSCIKNCTLGNVTYAMTTATTVAAAGGDDDWNCCCCADDDDDYVVVVVVQEGGCRCHWWLMAISSWRRPRFPLRSSYRCRLGPPRCTPSPPVCGTVPLRSLPLRWPLDDCCDVWRLVPRVGWAGRDGISILFWCYNVYEDIFTFIYNLNGLCIGKS